MVEELKNIIVQEAEALEQLLCELEYQHKCIVKNDFLGLEECVDKIKNCNINIAEYEMERRKITNGRPMSVIIEEIGDSETERYYRNITRMLTELKTQKETNELLIKQGLVFSTKMLNIFSPGYRNNKTYNSYGKIR
ncbi:MAG: flagellar protein FlgN [Bacillota bacterium]|nr:flagellar protein FlgN [Bacillota bacterium]